MNQLLDSVSVPSKCLFIILVFLSLPYFKFNLKFSDPLTSRLDEIACRVYFTGFSEFLLFQPIFDIYTFFFNLQGELGELQIYFKKIPLHQ